jgi:hypothetical protein
MRDRAIRLVADIADAAGTITAACRPVGEQLGINTDTLAPGSARAAHWKD